MASITIRRLDDSVKAKLRIRAATHGRSMEAEAREILKEGLAAKPPEEPNWVDEMRKRVMRYGGVDLKLPKREIYRPRRIFE